MKLIYIKNNAKRGRIIKSRFSIISYILQYITIFFSNKNSILR